MSQIETDPNWTDPDDALRVLQERRHLIMEMQQTEGWRVWSDFLASLAAGHQNKLLLGRAADMMEYKLEAGICEGIRLALTAAERLDGMIAAQERILEYARLTDEGEQL